MNEDLTEQERLERRRIADNFIAGQHFKKLEVADIEVADLEAYARGELSLEEVQARILARGEQEAERIRAEIGGPAERLRALLSAQDPVEAIRSLILNGTPEQIQLSAKILAASPGGYEALDGSVRQIVAGMGEAELRETWVNRIRPMLSYGNMLPPERLQKLEADVESLLGAYQQGSAVKKMKYVIAALVMACVIFFLLRSFSTG